ncbi:MAG: murein L,D-transpeptidase catalytic domain family protein [Cyclobacteriaceae bacterium]|nr:murein L,D-transpeptidase catalytic domain family protein [Cyclobacteriaceae bacterium]
MAKHLIINKWRMAISVVYAILLMIPRTSHADNHEKIQSLYQSIDFGQNESPDYEIFSLGWLGYDQLKKSGKVTVEILTLIDFRKPSTEKRLWVIDLVQKKLVQHSLVAHGQNSGELYAKKFSNKHNSHQSSLGFYITRNTYNGKHGLSLKLQGMEKSINDQAEARAIVMHGADYVSETFIRKVGRLGRSFGCPAIPSEIHQPLIKQVAGGSCLFIYYPDENYLNSSIVHSQEDAIMGTF